MDDPVSMRRGKRIRAFSRAGQGLIERQWTSCEPRRKRLAFQILHHQEVDAVLMTDVVQRADVRVGERRDGLRFAIEAGAELRIRGERAREDLDRHRAREARVGCSVDLAHPACPDQMVDAVRT